MRIICCIYKDFVRQLKALLRPFCRLCACEMSPGWGHLITCMDHSAGNLNGILAQVGGNLNNNFRKSPMPGGLPGGMLKLRFDRYISFRYACMQCLLQVRSIVSTCNDLKVELRNKIKIQPVGLFI